MKKLSVRVAASVSVMTISLQYTNVTVTNTEESLAFYRDALGLSVVNDVASGGFRWVTLGSDAQPGLGIVMSEPHAGRSQADGDALAELLIKGVLPMLVFTTDDLDAAYESAVAAGAASHCGAVDNRSGFSTISRLPLTSVLARWNA